MATQDPTFADDEDFETRLIPAPGADVGPDFDDFTHRPGPAVAGADPARSLDPPSAGGSARRAPDTPEDSTRRVGPYPPGDSTRRVGPKLPPVDPARARERNRPAGAREWNRPARARQRNRPAGAPERNRPAGAREWNRPARAPERNRPAGGDRWYTTKLAVAGLVLVVLAFVVVPVILTGSWPGRAADPDSAEAVVVRGVHEALPSASSSGSYRVIPPTGGLDAAATPTATATELPIDSPTAVPTTASSAPTATADGGAASPTATASSRATPTTGSTGAATRGASTSTARPTATSTAASRGSGSAGSGKAAGPGASATAKSGSSGSSKGGSSGAGGTGTDTKNGTGSGGAAQGGTGADPVASRLTLLGGRTGDQVILTVRLEAGGVPVAGAVVTSKSVVGGGSCTTGAEGTCALPPLLSADPLRVQVSTPGTDKYFYAVNDVMM